MSERFNTLNTLAYDQFSPFLGTIPFVIGGLLGAPIMGRELESGTARLTWSFSANRIRWFIWRLVPPTLLAVLLLAAVGIASNALSYQQTLIDPNHFFGGGHLRGLRLVARGAAAFGIAVLAGLVVRRVLPALIVGAVASVILYNALGWATFEWLPKEVLADSAHMGGQDAIPPGSQVWSVALEAPNGSFDLEYEVALANGFPRRTADGGVIEQDPAFIAWYTGRGYREVLAGWSPQRYPDLVLHESGALLGGTAVLLIGTAAALQRTRPGA
jgi:hypothetical protein